MTKLLLKRTLAYFIDIIIVVLVTYPLWSGEKSIIKQVLSIVILILYFSLMEYKLEQTIGKFITNIKVKTKGKLRFKQALIRNLSKASTIVLLIDSIPIIFKNKKQRYLERLSKTEVEDGKKS